MIEHSCPTGWHIVPCYVCYEKHGCTCVGCVKAYRDRWREKCRRLRGKNGQGVRADAAITRAQIMVLCEKGWTLTSLSATIGVKRQTLGEIVNQRKTVASARVRDGVGRVWDESLREEPA